MIAVQTAIYRASIIFDIPFVMYAEEGDAEYGGSTKLRNSPTYNKSDGINFYLSGFDPNKELSNFSKEETYWFTYPDEQELENKTKPELHHWSYFKNFVNYDHYLIAKEHCGLNEKKERSPGSIENFSTTDTYLVRLYYYFMYLKFGFGRVLSECTNDIRRGAMTRNQAINISRKLDGEKPGDDHIKMYLDYYSMDLESFNDVIDKWANKDLFYKNNEGIWTPKFELN